MRGARIVLAGVMLLMCAVFMYFQSSMTQKRFEDSIEQPDHEPELAGNGQRPKQLNPALQEIDKVMYSAPEQALEKTREFLKNSNDTEERIQGSERLRRALAKTFEKAIGQRDYASAGKLAGELQMIAPEQRETQEVLQRWNYSRQEWLRTSLEKNDLATAERLLAELYDESPKNFASSFRNFSMQLVEKRVKRALDNADYIGADALFADLLGNPRGLDPYWLAQQYCAYQIERYKRDKNNKDAGRARLVEASAMEGVLMARGRERYTTSDFNRYCREEWSTEELLSLGDDAMKRGAFESAEAFYSVGYSTTQIKVTYDKSGVPTSTTLSGEPYASQGKMLMERLDRCTLQLCDRIYAGKVMCVEPEAGMRLIESVADSRRFPKGNPELYEEAVRKLADMQVKFARDHIAAGRVQQARNILDVYKENVARLWRIECDKGYDPWKDMPPDVKAQAEAGSKDVNARLRTVENLIYSGKYRPPQGTEGYALLKSLEQAAEVAKQQAEEQRVLQMLKNPRANFDGLRALLRKSKTDPLAQRIKDAVENAIRWAQKQNDLSALNDLCGFYVSEMGPPKADDPFKEDLRVALKYAADQASNNPMTRVFLLSLMADALPGDPTAEKARREAMEKGLEVMRQTRSQAMDKPALQIPSLINGYSVLAVENSTEYHLMIFLDGPERCMVRLNPYRRGSLVVKDGKYVTAVVVTAEQVIPYRSETTYASELSAHRYVIVHEGQKAQPAEWTFDRSGGPYELLRTPPDAGVFTIDPKSGMVLKAGR